MLPIQKSTIDKEILNFLNSLRCPICESQLDGSIHNISSNLYCVLYPEEYKVSYIKNSKSPERESLKYYYSDHEYIIRNLRLKDDMYEIFVARYSRDVGLRYKLNTEKIILKYEGARFTKFSKKLEEKDFLKKLRLYSIFS